MVARRERTSDAWELAGLPADHPDPALAEKLRLFGQFVGDWTIDARYPQPDGSEIRRTGAVHFRWILGGRAIQDTFSNLQGNPPREVAAGTTVRLYDPKQDAWLCVWVSPPQNVMRTFIGRPVDGEIVLEETTAGGHRERWIFSEITPQSFRWRAVDSPDDGKTWSTLEEMRVNRATRGR
jgi:hypothetical protein